MKILKSKNNLEVTSWQENGAMKFGLFEFQSNLGEFDTREEAEECLRRLEALD